MYCRKCGKQIDDNADICIHCGKPTKEQATPKDPNSSLSSRDVKILLIAGICFVVMFVIAMMWVFAHK